VLCNCTVVRRVFSHDLFIFWSKMKYEKDALRQVNNDLANNANRVFCIDFSLSQESLTCLTFERNINSEIVNK